MHDKKLFGTATVGTKGQVVIPAEARKALGIEEGERLYVFGSEQGKLVAFIKEEHFQKMVSNITDSLETYKDALKEKE